MNKIVLSFAMVLIMISTAYAGNVYLGVTGGTTSITDTTFNIDDGSEEEYELDLGYNIGTQIGYDFGKIRTAFEYTYRNFDIDSGESDLLPGVEFDIDGDVAIHSYMAAVYFDIENKTKLTPYIGAGIGMATIDINDASVLGVAFNDDSDNVFAYKFEVGAGYEVVKNLSLTAAYEYFATAEGDFESLDDPPLGSDADLDSHNFKFGFRYAF